MHDKTESESWVPVIFLARGIAELQLMTDYKSDFEIASFLENRNKLSESKITRSFLFQIPKAKFKETITSGSVSGSTNLKFNATREKKLPRVTLE